MASILTINQDELKQRSIRMALYLQLRAKTNELQNGSVFFSSTPAMCPTDLEYTNTDEKLQDAAKQLGGVSSSLELARQMLQCSWSAVTLLRKELRENREANDALLQSYETLDSEHQDLRRMYGDLSQDFNQLQAIANYYQDYVGQVEIREKRLAEEKQLMRAAHEEALVVAADRISALERALGDPNLSDSTIGSTSPTKGGQRGGRRPKKRTRKAARTESTRAGEPV
ncbi:hypothetical protein SLS60_011927 [Paraconiothyrium brasiliense]|uniref:Uncharacterized protein n=1 Tax=Paraconiothyrium brasiliense TaxID=300254 RepID=A0ABR3QHA1_9PLEO